MHSANAKTQSEEESQGLVSELEWMLTYVYEPEIVYHKLARVPAERGRVQGWAQVC